MNAAVDSGCDLRIDTRLDELLWDDGSVTGARLRSDTGALTDERSRIVVGADGMRSTVAQHVHAATYNEVPPMIGVFYTY